MAASLYAADPPETLRTVELEGLTLLYHRRSGLTHILAPPAPQILAALAAGPASAGMVEVGSAKGSRSSPRTRRRHQRPAGGAGSRGPRLADMNHVFRLQVGPVAFRIGSQWRGPIAALRRLYAGYPEPEGVCDFTVRLEAERVWRRWLRPSVAIRGDYVLPDAAPLPLAQGLLAAEMGMNLQMALGQKSFLLLHAASVEREGRALLMTGHSGAGKSTLAALLGERGWRFMGDEFALLDLDDGRLHPFPRAVSLKNESLGLFDGIDPGRLGPVLEGTPKGTIRHLRPNAEAVARMDEAARPC